MINYQAAVSSEGTRTVKGGDGSTYAFLTFVLRIKDVDSVHMHPRSLSLLEMSSIGWLCLLVLLLDLFPLCLARHRVTNRSH